MLDWFGDLVGMIGELGGWAAKEGRPQCARSPRFRGNAVWRGPACTEGCWSKFCAQAPPETWHIFGSSSAGKKARPGMGSTARLAQSAGCKALNLVVVGSSPTVGVLLSLIFSTAYANTPTAGLSLLSAWAL